MWRIWRVIDPMKAIVLTGLLIAFVSTTIHLIQISGDRYNINSWHPDTAKAAKAAQNAALPQKYGPLVFIPAGARGSYF